MTVLSLALIVAVSLVATVLGIYYSLTKPIPVPGGEYSEGIIGQPMYVNPVLAAGNEADADLTRLIYSGLFKYGSDGKIVPDLAEDCEVSNDRLSYTVRLKNDVKWHDGETFSSDDVIYSIQAIQDPAFKSPLRQNWQGVGMEHVDDNTIKFMLPSPYSFFLSNLTVGILPKHVWETVMPTNFSLAEYNLRPVGTGPFKVSDFEKDSGGMILSYKLIANPDYFGDKPYLSSMTFQFYPDEDSMLDAYNSKQIFGTSSVSPEKMEGIKSKRSPNVISASLPRYFAVFFNQQKSKALADKAISRLPRAFRARLDNVIYRAGFVKTRRAARQMVGHGHVLVNGRRVNVPSFKVEKGMTVSIRPESRDSALFVNRTDVMAETKAPAWLKFEDQGFSVQVIENPGLGEGEAPFSAPVIIQFYSR